MYKHKIDFLDSFEIDPRWTERGFERDATRPFMTLRQTSHTGKTPPPTPPPISPIGSPPETTPRTPVIPVHTGPWKSPVRPPTDIPPFQLRRVHTPPSVIFSPMYYHSTPRKTPVDIAVDYGRFHRDRIRREAISKMGSSDYLMYTIPIAHRVDVNSLIGDTLLPLNTPPRRASPEYQRAKKQARSPTLEVMRHEIMRSDEDRKYLFWIHRNHVNAAMRDNILRRIRMILCNRIQAPQHYHNMNNITVDEAIAMLSTYLKEITDKLISQNLELPELPSNNPAMSIINRKKISIRRILQEFQDENMHLESKLMCIKEEIARFNKYTERIDFFTERIIKRIEEFGGVEDMMKRIIEQEGLCVPHCGNHKLERETNRENEVKEAKLNQLRSMVLEIETESMHAAADVTQFADEITPHFIQNLAELIRSFPMGINYRKVDPAVYSAAAHDVATHLRRIFKHKRGEWEVENREIDELRQAANAKEDESRRLEQQLQERTKEKHNMELDLKKLELEKLTLEWMIVEARRSLEFSEQGYAATYSALNRLKKMTVEMETELGMTPRGPPELFSEEPAQTSSPTATDSQIPSSVSSPPAAGIGLPTYASSPITGLGQPQQEASIAPHSLGRQSPSIGKRSPSQRIPQQSSIGFDDFLMDESPPDEMLNISGLSSGGASYPHSLEGSPSPLDSLEKKDCSIKETFEISNPGKQEPLQMDFELIPQGIGRSPSGQRVLCDLSLKVQEANVRRPRGIEKRKILVRGTPPPSQTVGRRFDRKYGMFTPKSSFRRRNVGVRGPLFEGDFESPPSPWGTGRKTHPELMNLTPHVPTPRSPRLDRTMEWEHNIPK